jgi:hypothetical protein
MEGTSIRKRSVSKAAAIRLLRGLGLRPLIIPPLRNYFRYCPIQIGKVLVWNQVACHLWWLESRVRASTYFGSVLDVDARDYCGRLFTISVSGSRLSPRSLKGLLDRETALSMLGPI